MPEYRQRDYSFLDKIRTENGNESCIAAFKTQCEKDKRRAAFLLNDGRLTFTCLYILAPLIQEYQMERDLGPVKAAALRFIRTANEPTQPDEPHQDPAYTALRWIWDTGYADDGMNDDFEELLEIAASILIGQYRDMKVLPALLGLIFKRNRQGHNIHQLVWAAFNSRSPQVLALIAQRMRSEDEEDTRLACNLLGIETPEAPAVEGQKHYEAFSRWLKENDPFLYFTGESFQLASQPAFYRVDLERKYLHRGTPSYDPQPVEPGDETEREALAAFNTLGADEKALLSEYSHKVRQENPAEWRRWVQRPIDEQVKTAKLNREAFHDYGIRFYV